jgi:heat shock protein HslJ
MNKLFLATMFWVLILNCASCTKDNIQTPNDFDKIQNSSWRFIAFDSSGIITKLDPADTILLTFKKSGLIEGESSGLCGNDYHGVYSIDGNNIRLDSLFSSEALCPSSRYWDYYYTLQEVSSFQLDDSHLYLYYRSNRQRLIFE